jgi:hypothetical protein
MTSNPPAQTPPPKRPAAGPAPRQPSYSTSRIYVGERTTIPSVEIGMPGKWALLPLREGQREEGQVRIIPGGGRSSRRLV